MYAQPHHLGYSDPQVLHHHLVHMQEQQPVMPHNPINQGYYHPSYQLYPLFVDRKVPYFDVNNAIDWCHKGSNSHPLPATT